METKTDALGNPILFGNLYGMSRNSNGHTSVIIGYARKITESGKVTLEVAKRMHSIYTDNVKQDIIGSNSVSVLGSALFPVETIEFIK